MGLGEISAEFEMGTALAETIRQSASQNFRRVEDVGLDACGPDTEALIVATLAAPPHLQVHWRDETPRVGGGSVAEIVIRLRHVDCHGREMSRAVAYGFGLEEHLQGGANWPSEDDFRPGIERALSSLSVNLDDAFSDFARALDGSQSS